MFTKAKGFEDEVFARRERAGKYYVIDVSPGGAAARSGAVKAGDVLHAVEGTAVRGLDQVPIPACARVPAQHAFCCS